MVDTISSGESPGLLGPKAPHRVHRHCSPYASWIRFFKTAPSAIAPVAIASFISRDRCRRSRALRARARPPAERPSGVPPACSTPPWGCGIFRVRWSMNSTAFLLPKSRLSAACLGDRVISQHWHLSPVRVAPPPGCGGVAGECERRSRGLQVSRTASRQSEPPPLPPVRVGRSRPVVSCPLAKSESIGCGGGVSGLGRRQRWRSGRPCRSSHAPGSFQPRRSPTRASVVIRPVPRTTTTSHVTDTGPR